MDEIVNCLIFLLILLGSAISIKRDRNWKSLPRTEFMDMGKREEPREYIDGSPAPGTRTVWRVQASDADIERLMRSGTTAQGNVTRVFTRVGKRDWNHLPSNKFDISVVDWKTEPPPKPDGVSWDDYFAALQKAGWR